MALPSHQSSSAHPRATIRSGPPFRRDDLALPGELEKGRELFQRVGELRRASCLSVRVLCLQKAMECGYERAGDVVYLQAHESALHRSALGGSRVLSVVPSASSFKGE